MGDGGSHFIGFLLSTITLIIFRNLEFSSINDGRIIENYQNVLYLSPEILVLLAPVFEMFIVIVSRIKNKLPVIYGDRRHLHYRLIDYGYSENKTATLICAGYLFIAGISFLNLSKFMSIFYFCISLPIIFKNIHRKNKTY